MCRLKGLGDPCKVGLTGLISIAFVQLHVQRLDRESDTARSCSDFARNFRQWTAGRNAMDVDCLLELEKLPDVTSILVSLGDFVWFAGSREVTTNNVSPCICCADQ